MEIYVQEELKMETEDEIVQTIFAEMEKEQGQKVELKEMFNHMKKIQVAQWAQKQSMDAPAEEEDSEVAEDDEEPDGKDE